MKEQKVQKDDINKVTSTTSFSDMSGFEKLKFVGKVVIFLVTGGFLFPTLFSD